MIRSVLILLMLGAGPAAALDLTFPGAAETGRDDTPAGSVRLPDRPWSVDAPPPSEVEGSIRRRAYRIAGGALTTLQLMEPARSALAGAGYDEVFTCSDAACGGFDFRFQLDLLPEPAMHVDLGDYRYLLARKPDAEGEPQTVALVASRSADAGHLHVTELRPAVAAEIPDAGQEQAAPEVALAPAAPAPAGIGAALQSTGRVILGDLDFGSGSDSLAPGETPSLSALADWLRATPGARIALVGHSDATGSLEANTAISRRRAEAVARRLVEEFGIDPSRIEALGAGYLAPLATNLTEEGRAANRRVEAVLLSLGG